MSSPQIYIMLLCGMVQFATAPPPILTFTIDLDLGVGNADRAAIFWTLTSAAFVDAIPKHEKIVFRASRNVTHAVNSNPRCLTNRHLSRHRWQ